MAFTASFTIKLGAGDKGDVTIGAGAAEAASDQMTLNIDATKMSKGDALLLVEKLGHAISAAVWPVNA
ncbi:hypothetical protein HT136_01415 [Novosphingobium profundi]|uniref:hypothetical protein n=1 Tax=Novosphingobium profundi TaxID=1774954 RepID=UPI001BD97147|nr:hypothetical protein [Novosphingobium profundi]MBT0667025.1 hypothetical protein [Novosphingobium profundi]